MALALGNQEMMTKYILTIIITSISFQIHSQCNPSTIFANDTTNAVCFEAIDNVICPIGDPTLGKHPQQIALGVANDLIHLARRKKARTQGPGRKFLRGEN